VQIVFDGLPILWLCARHSVLAWMVMAPNGTNPSITFQELVAFLGDVLARGFWGDITIRCERDIKSVRLMTVILPGTLTVEVSNPESGGPKNLEIMGFLPRQHKV
jgi:hypothetical protein